MVWLNKNMVRYLTTSSYQGMFVEGLHRYFESVSCSNCSKAEKLEKIVSTFSSDCVLNLPDGRKVHGHEGVRNFYDSPQSPVLKRKDFKPVIVKGTECYSPDKMTCSMQIDLPISDSENIRVGDWFHFDDEGKIKTLTIFSIQ
eukprot:g2358.t1